MPRIGSDLSRDPLRSSIFYPDLLGATPSCDWSCSCYRCLALLPLLEESLLLYALAGAQSLMSFHRSFQVWFGNVQSQQLKRQSIPRFKDHDPSLVDVRFTKESSALDFWRWLQPEFTWHQLSQQPATWAAMASFWKLPPFLTTDFVVFASIWGRAWRSGTTSTKAFWESNCQPWRISYPVACWSLQKGFSWRTNCELIHLTSTMIFCSSNGPPRKLAFGGLFNQSVAGITFPSSLQHLSFGRRFNQPLDLKLPSNLLSLTFKEQFKQPLTGKDSGNSWLVKLLHLHFSKDIMEIHAKKM